MCLRLARSASSCARRADRTARILARRAARLDDGRGRHAVRIAGLGSIAGRLGFDRVERPGSAAAPRGIDQNRRVVLPSRQLVGEMHAANAEIDDVDAVGRRFAGKAPGDLDAEPVVAQKDVADAGHEHSRHHIARMRRYRFISGHVFTRA